MASHGSDLIRLIHGSVQRGVFGLGSGMEQPQLHDDAYACTDELNGTGAAIYWAIIDRHRDVL